MKINELEKILGIERANIRYYEREGLIDPKRGDNGYRDIMDTAGDYIEKVKQEDSLEGTTPRQRAEKYYLRAIRSTLYNCVIVALWWGVVGKSLISGMYFAGLFILILLMDVLLSYLGGKYAGGSGL